MRRTRAEVETDDALPQRDAKPPAPARSSASLARLAAPERAARLLPSGVGTANASVARVLARQTCACGGTIGPDGQCDKCREEQAGTIP